MVSTPRTAGEFGCWAENGIVDDGMAYSASSANFSLTINDTGDSVLAVIVDLEHPLETVDHGDTVEAICTAYGNPLPTIFWSRVVPCDYNNGKECVHNITEAVYYAVATYGDSSVSKSVLQLCNVSDDDEGTYRCTAWNDIRGDQTTSEWDLDVSPPTVSTERPVDPSRNDSTVCRTEDDSRVYRIALSVMAAVILLLLVIIGVFICYLGRRTYMEYRPSKKAKESHPESGFSFSADSAPRDLPNFPNPITMRSRQPFYDNHMPDSFITNPIFDPDKQPCDNHSTSDEDDDSDDESSESNHDGESSDESSEDDSDFSDSKSKAEADSYTVNK